MEYKRTEIRSGLMICISIIIFCIVVLQVKDVKNMFRKTKTLIVTFQFSGGIEKHSPVRYAGIKVGEVTSISIPHDKIDKVKISIAVDANVPIREDSSAVVETMGLMGEKYIEISPGSPHVPIAANGGTIAGQDTIGAAKLFALANQIGKSLNNLVEKVDNTVTSITKEELIPKTIKDIQLTITDIRETSIAVRSIISQLNDSCKTVDNMTGNIDRAISENLTSVEATIDNIEQFTQHLVDDASDVKDTVKRPFESTDKIILSNSGNIFALTENLKDLSFNLKLLSEDLRAHPWKLIFKAKSSQETRGDRLTDKEFIEKGRLPAYGEN